MHHEANQKCLAALKVQKRIVLDSLDPCYDVDTNIYNNEEQPSLIDYTNQNVTVGISEATSK
jgi:hypothetical protein